MFRYPKGFESCWKAKLSLPALAGKGNVSRHGIVQHMYRAFSRVVCLMVRMVRFVQELTTWCLPERNHAEFSSSMSQGSHLNRSTQGTRLVMIFERWPWFGMKRRMTSPSILWFAKNRRAARCVCVLCEPLWCNQDTRHNPETKAKSKSWMWEIMLCKAGDHSMPQIWSLHARYA